MPSISNLALPVLIRKLEGVRSLSGDERRALKALPTTIKVLRPRLEIIQAGDRLSHCYLIVEGWTCCYRLLAEGRRQILAFHVPGDVPDLQCLHLSVADHSLATLTACTVAFIPQEALHAVAAQHPGLAALLWRETQVTAAIGREWLVCLGRRSAYQRLAHLMCETYLRLEAVGLASNHTCPLPVTQTDLADVLGLSHVHVNRTLQELRGANLITLKGSRLVINNWPGLVEAAEFDPTYLHMTERPASRSGVTDTPAYPT